MCELALSSIKGVLVVPGAHHSSACEADPDFYKQSPDLLEIVLRLGTHRNAARSLC